MMYVYDAINKTKAKVKAKECYDKALVSGHQARVQHLLQAFTNKTCTFQHNHEDCHNDQNRKPVKFQDGAACFEEIRKHGLYQWCVKVLVWESTPQEKNKSTRGVGKIYENGALVFDGIIEFDEEGNTRYFVEIFGKIYVDGVLFASGTEDDDDDAIPLTLYHADGMTPLFIGRRLLSDCYQWFHPTGGGTFFDLCGKKLTKRQRNEWVQSESKSSSICSFAFTQRVLSKQLFFRCVTCTPNQPPVYPTYATLICETCARVCHYDHDLVAQSKIISSYCDCGAKELLIKNDDVPFKCKCLKYPKANEKK